jgi:hypothetical protein
MSSLNHEVVYYRQLELYRKEFEDKVEQLGGDLKKALFKLGTIQRQIGHEWAQLKQGSRADV